MTTDVKSTTKYNEGQNVPINKKCTEKEGSKGVDSGYQPIQFNYSHLTDPNLSLCSWSAFPVLSLQQLPIYWYYGCTPSPSPPFIVRRLA